MSRSIRARLERLERAQPADPRPDLWDVPPEQWEHLPPDFWEPMTPGHLEQLPPESGKRRFWESMSKRPPLVDPLQARIAQLDAELAATREATAPPPRLPNALRELPPSDDPDLPLALCPDELQAAPG